MKVLHLVLLLPKHVSCTSGEDTSKTKQSVVQLAKALLKQVL